MKYIDAHCHLKSNLLPPDVGVAITNATHPDDWESVTKIAGQGGIYGAIGVHPWHATNLMHGWDEQMCKLLEKNPHLMVGEIGLDKNYPDLPTQLDVFVTQLKLASRYGRAAHIHCVGAWDKLLSALANDTPPAIVLHGAATSREIVNALLKYNTYFSFGRAICNPTHARARNALQSVPQNRILTESDSDTPIDVAGVVSKMAEILNRPLADMKNTIYNNAMELLKNG